MASDQTRSQEFELRRVYGQKLLTDPDLDKYDVQLFFEVPPGRRGKGALFIPRRVRSWFSHEETDEGRIGYGKEHFWRGNLSKKQLQKVLEVFDVDQPEYYNCKSARFLSALGEDRIPFSLEYYAEDERLTYGMVIYVNADLSSLSQEVLRRITAPVAEFPSKGVI